MKKDCDDLMITVMITIAKHIVTLIISNNNDLKDLDVISCVSGHFPTNDHPEPLHLALQQQEDHVHGQVSGF